MKTLLPALLALSLAGAAHAQTVVGPLPPFRSIELKGGGRVILRQGPERRVTLVEGDQAITRIEVKDQGRSGWGKTRRTGRLEIVACARACPKAYKLVVVVTAPRLDAVAVLSGGAIRTDGPFSPQGNLAVAVDSGGVIDVRAIRASHVAAAVDKGGTITVSAKTALAAAIDDGGLILYEGSPMLVSAVDGGGSVRKVSDAGG
jgi:hypothetical protein